MLRFYAEPDRAFSEIVRIGLEFSIDDLIDPHRDDATVMSAYSERTGNIFSREELFDIHKKLLDAHLSDKLYKLTCYHELILFEVVSKMAEANNDYYASEKETFLDDPKIKQIDIGAIVDVYFGDTDFYMEKMDRQTAGRISEQMGCVDGFEGVVSENKPSPEEIALVPATDTWPISRDNTLYKEGEDYPYFGDLSEGELFDVEVQQAV